MCRTHVQFSIASILVSYTRTIHYCQYPCVIHTYSALLLFSMYHTHVQFNIARFHISYTLTVHYSQHPCVVHTYNSVLLVSMCHTHIQCSIAIIHVSYTRTMHYCYNLRLDLEGNCLPRRESFRVSNNQKSLGARSGE